MKKKIYGLIILLMLTCSVSFARADVSIGIGTPNLSIGINLPTYPQLVPVSGYPVYYAPQVAGNYFFYDGMYWVYQDDNWYASSWYNGPWAFVEPIVRAGFHSASSRALLPAATAIFPRLAVECATPLGSALGTSMGTASPWLG